MSKQKIWHVVRLYNYGGGVQEYLFEYYNRGHAIAKYKKLCRDAWKAKSKVCYAIRKG